MARKTILVFAAGLLAFTTAACNTVRGVGQDLQSVANEVDEET